MPGQLVQRSMVATHAPVAAAVRARRDVAAAAAGQSSDSGGSHGNKDQGNQKRPRVQNHANFDLHVAALDEIEGLVPAGSLERTVKGCRADFGYHKGGVETFLPIIVHAASLGRARHRNPTDSCMFETRPRVVGSMPGLQLCRPYPHKAETLVIPETTTGSSKFRLTYKENTKWYPFFVADRQLAGVLEGVYDSVGAGQQVFTLPSGKDLDISGLGFISHAELCMPTGADHQKAREFFLLREQWLPAIHFQLPRNLYTPVDAVVDGVKIGDRTAHDHKRTRMYMARLSRRYKEDDVDVLWAYHPDKDHFWLIPAHVLLEKGILATPQQPGRENLSLYDHG